VFLDEYNISWSWEVRDPRMTDNKSAVFDALTMSYALLAGADETMAWNEYDGVYGKLGASDEVRPGGNNFHIFNALLRGDWVQTQDSDPGSVAAFGVVDKSTHRSSVLLINRSDQSQSVQISGLTPQFKIGDKLVQYQISKPGFKEVPVSLAETIAKPINLPDNSVTVLTEAR
jgi:xylan 1,4-beta-xylosidase